MTGSAALDRLMPSAAALDRLVYLVGPVRGGTTIIHRAMNVHPKAMVLPQLTHFMQHVWRYRRQIHERLLRELLRMPEWWEERAIHKRLGDEGYAQYLRIVNRAFARRDLAEMYKLYPIAYALTPAFDKNPADIVCWHDKHNDWRHLGTLARAFPSAKFLFIARDPRSVALSAALRTATMAGEITKYPNRGDLIGMALYWRFLLQRCLAMTERYPERCMVVRYEDFLAAPAATLNRIFAFTTGETMPPEAIDRALAGVSGRATNTGERYSGVDQAPRERWKTALNAEDADLVAQLTGATARRLGYDIAPESRLGAFRSIRGIAGTARVKAQLKLLLSEAYELRLTRSDFAPVKPVTAA